MKNTNVSTEQLIEQLEAAYSRWKSHSLGEYCNYGCGDGAMMNMERTRIIHLKEDLAAKHLDDYPDVFYREIPKEVDRNLWVNMRSWDARGRKLLKRYKSDTNYLFLLSVLPQLTDKQRQSTCIDVVIGYVQKFEYALNSWRNETGSDYDYRWYVRRHVSCPFFDSLAQCVEKIKQLDAEFNTALGAEENGQMCFLFM